MHPSTSMIGHSEKIKSNKAHEIIYLLKFGRRMWNSGISIVSRSEFLSACDICEVCLPGICEVVVPYAFTVGLAVGAAAFL